MFIPLECSAIKTLFYILKKNTLLFLYSFNDPLLYIQFWKYSDKKHNYAQYPILFNRHTLDL